MHFGSSIPYHLPDDMPVLVMCTYGAFKMHSECFCFWPVLGENNSISSSTTFLPDVNANLRIGGIMWLPL